MQGSGPGFRARAKVQGSGSEFRVRVDGWRGSENNNNTMLGSGSGPEVLWLEALWVENKREGLGLDDYGCS